MTSLTEPQLVALIRAKFPAPEYATFGSVRNATGYVRPVAADALEAAAKAVGK